MTDYTEQERDLAAKILDEELLYEPGRDPTREEAMQALCSLVRKDLGYGMAIQRLESWLAADEMRTAVISLGPCGSMNVSLTEHRIEPEDDESEVEQWEVTEQSPLEIAILNCLAKANRDAPV